MSRLVSLHFFLLSIHGSWKTRNVSFLYLFYFLQVNSLGEELTAEFEEIINKFSNDTSAKSAVLISGKPGCFIAGADIKVSWGSLLNLFI